MCNPCCRLCRAPTPSRGEVEGTDCHRQGSPGGSPSRVQPHQPGTQPAGQDAQKGLDTLYRNTWQWLHPYTLMHFTHHAQGSKMG